MKYNTDIKEITGMKGAAALIVMLSHYMIAFFPAMWNAEYHLEHIVYIEKIVHRTPLYFFVNGSQMVNVFWCISGFLIAYGWYQTRSIQLIKSRILSRYFKLVIPIAVSMLLTYFFQVSNLLYNEAASHYTWSEWLGSFFQFEPSLFTCIVDGVFGVFFKGSGKYNPVLWTIRAEILGICFSALFLLIWGDDNIKKRKKVYIFLTIVVNLFYQPLFSFLVGIIVCDMFLQGFKYTKWQSAWGMCVALLLGSFLPIWKFIPGEILISNDWGISIGEIFRAVAAGIFLIGVLHLKRISTVLQTRVFVFLGEISMYIYIYHFLILCSISCGIFIYLYKSVEAGYIFSALISSIIGIVISILLSYFLKLMMQKSISKIMNRIYRIF